MLLTLLAVTAGLVGGYFRKGQLAHIVTVAPKWMILLVPSLLLFVATSVGIPTFSLNLTIVALFGLTIGLLRNYEIKGSSIIGFGLLLNLVVLVTNGHVPVRSDALAAVTDGGAVDIDSLNAIENLEDGETVLAQLGDIIPVPFLDVIVSFGDLIALAGLIVLIVNATLRDQPHGRISVDQLFSQFEDITTYAPEIDLRDPVASDDEIVVIKPTGTTVESRQH